MPATIVTDPTGKKWRVNHPDGASNAEIQSYVMDQLRQRADAPEVQRTPDEQIVQGVADKLGPIDRFSIGVKESLRTAASRIPGLLTDEAKAQAAQERELTKQVGGVSAGLGRAYPVILGTARIGASGALESAGAGAVSGYLTGEDKDTGALAGAIGGGAGYALGSVVGKVANAVAGKFASREIADGSGAEAMREAQKLGFRFAPGAASQSGVSKTIDAAMKSNPASGAAYYRLAQQNTKRLNQIAAKAIGVNANDLGPQTLQAADDYLSRGFERVAQATPPIRVNSSLKSDLEDTLSKTFLKRYEGELANGNLSGRSYMDLRSRLLQITRTNSDRADYAWDAIEALDNEVASVAPKALQKYYDGIREQYRVLVSLEKYSGAIRGGDLREGTLDTALKKVFKKTYTRDAGSKLNLKTTEDFLTAVRALSDPRVGNPFGNSGTADRLLTWAGLSGLIYDPVHTGAAMAGAAALGASRLGAPAPAVANVGGNLGRVLPPSQQ